MKKNKKHALLNIVLSLCLCLSLFFGSCMTADAAYATGRFPFDATAIPDNYFENYPYFYIFQVRGNCEIPNPVCQYSSGKTLHSFGVFGKQSSFYKDSGSTCIIFSSHELFLQKNNPNVVQPMLVLSCTFKGVTTFNTVICHFYSDEDGVTFNSSPEKNYLLPGNDYVVACYFNPQMVYVMSNTDVRDADSGEVLYYRNVPDGWITSKRNTSDISSSENIDISDNSDSKFELLPEESDGTPWGNLWSHLAKVINGIAGIGVKIDNFKDACIDRFISGMDKTRIAVLDVLDNVKDLPSAFVQSIKEGKIFDPFNVLFDGVNLKILDVIDYVKNLPREIGKILSQDGLFGLLETVIDKISEIQGWIWENPLVQSVADIVSSVWDIGESLINIPVEVGKVFRTVFEELFVPSDGYLSGKLNEFGDTFPFIGSIRSIVFSLTRRIETFGSTPPEIPVPLSKTFLGQYGVADCTMTFEWFHPYRGTVLLIETAFLYGMFAFRLYFGIKNMFSATSNFIPYADSENWRF